MKFLYVTDTHWRINRPKVRTDDDYLASILDEFRPVVGDAKNVDFVVHCGDVFETPHPNVRCLIAFKKLLDEIQKPIYIVPGQHDYHNHNISTWKDDSAIGLLHKPPIRVLNNPSSIHACEFTTEVDVWATGVAFDDILNFKELANDSHKVRIIGFHKPISYSDSEFASGIEAFKKQMLKWFPKQTVICLFGDIHDFQYEETVDNITFLAAGAFCKKTVHDIDRPMRYAIVTVENGKVSTEWKEVKVPKESFVTNEVKSTDQFAKQFSDVIDAAVNNKTESLTDRIDRVGKELKFPTNIISKVREECESL